MASWIENRIGSLFKYTIPGEWGAESDPENGIPVIRSTNFRNDGKIDYSDVAYRSVDEKKLKLRLISKGDILFEKSGGSPSQAAGRVVYCETDFRGTGSNFVEIAKVKDELDPKFIFYLLFQLYKEGRINKYQQQTTGLINFKLNEYLTDEYVNIPPDRNEQSLIASIITTADEFIDQTEKLIAKYQRIKTGLMQDLLTRGIDEHGNIRKKATHKFVVKNGFEVPEEWSVEALGSLVKAVDAQPDHRTPPLVENGIAYLGISDIDENGNIDIKKCRKVSNKILEEHNKRYALRDGDIIFGKIGTIGEPKRLMAWNNITISANVILLQPFETPSFIFWVLNSEYVNTQVKNSIHSTTQPAFGMEKIRALKILTPPKNERETIQDILNQKEANILSTRILLSKLQSIKTGLMQDLLSGKVRVKLQPKEEAIA